MSTQELRDSIFIASDSRTNFKQIIAKRSDQVKFAGGRIRPNASAGNTVEFNAGLVLGFATSGADSGFYKAYNSANTDGSQVAVGVLAENALNDDAGNGSEISVIRGKGMTLFKDKLIGLDAGAIANLGAVSYVEHGVNLLDL